MTDANSCTRLIGQIVRVGDVSAADRSQMFALMCDHYANMRRDRFEADFDMKDWVIVARDDTVGDIHGFSTQVTYVQTIDGQDFRILFSGDTIVQREYWANNPLSQLWGQLALALMDAYPDDQLYWFLISKGYKTYRFLPVFFREFFPRYDSTTPSSMKRLIEAVALARFGKRFCSETGVLRALECDCHLRAEVADVTENRLKNRHVAFFDQANPGHANGDELCCIARLTRDNLNQKAYRVIGHPMDLQSLVEGSPSVGQ